MLTIDKFNSNKKVDRTQNSVSILSRRKLPSTSLGKNERQNENPNTKEKKIKARDKQPIEASIGIYSLFINGFFLTFLFVCLFVYKVLLFKETLNIEKEDTEEESKTFLSHFDKLAYELINGSSNYINYDLSNLSLSHSEASENY